jgi:hypothetical protein
MLTQIYSTKDCLLELYLFRSFERAQEFVTLCACDGGCIMLDSAVVMTTHFFLVDTQQKITVFLRLSGSLLSES